MERTLELPPGAILTFDTRETGRSNLDVVPGGEAGTAILVDTPSCDTALANLEPPNDALEAATTEFLPPAGIL